MLLALANAAASKEATVEIFWGKNHSAYINILIQIGLFDITQAVWRPALFWYGCCFVFYIGVLDHNRLLFGVILSACETPEGLCG